MPLPSGPALSVDVKNFGPFKRAKIDIKPLTIIVGRNSVGKSMLLYLLWILTHALPDFELWSKLVSERESAWEVAIEAFEKLKRGQAPVEEARCLLRAHLSAFPEAWGKGLAGPLREVFGVRTLRDLAGESELPVSITVHGKRGSLEITLDEEARGRWLRCDYEIVREVRVEALSSSNITLKYGEFVASEFVRDPTALLIETATFISAFLRELVGSVAQVSTPALFVDGRAGIIRTLLAPYPAMARSIIKEILYADSSFVEEMYRLARLYEDGQVDLGIEPAKLLLEEFGVKLKTVTERGVPRFYIDTWANREHPIERAPSGPREAIALVCALAAAEEPELLFVEEPEAHLHPRAIRYLARLLAYSVNTHKRAVVLTTHSDTLVYQLNNLIALSGKPEKAKELGISEHELIKPDRVAAYLVKPVGRRAVVQPLGLDEAGFDESAFADVAREIADERYEALG